MQTLTSLTTCVLQDPAEAITPCYLQVLFWPDPVALTTKEDHRSECNQERNVFVSESLGFRNRIGPVLMSWWWPSKILSHSGTVLRIHISRANFQLDKKGLSQSQIFTLTSDIITPYTQRKNNQCALEIFFFPTIRNELSFIKKDDEVVIQSSKANNFIFSISYFI